MIRNAPSGLRRWREVKRRPVQGNSQNDRILHGPDCNRHKRVYADSFPATPLPQIPGIFPECVWGGMRNLSVRWGSNQYPKRVRRTASRWSAPRLRWPHREFTMRFCRRLLSFAEQFKNARALEMRLFRHGGIYRSDVSSHLINLVPGSRFTVGSGPGYRTRRKNTPCPSSAMSSGRLFLDRVARQHCPSPLHRHTQINMHSAEARGKGDISTLPGRGHFYFALTKWPGCTPDYGVNSRGGSQTS
jgi:hypothetical protein